MRSLPRLAAAAVVAGWLVVVCGGMVASPTRAALPLPSGLVPALPLPTIAPAPSPTSTAASKPTPRPTLASARCSHCPRWHRSPHWPCRHVGHPHAGRFPTLAPIPTPALSDVAPAHTHGGADGAIEIPGTEPFRHAQRQRRAPPAPSPSDVRAYRGQAGSGRTQGGGPRDAVGSQPDGGCDADSQAHPRRLAWSRCQRPRSRSPAR